MVFIEFREVDANVFSPLLSVPPKNVTTVLRCCSVEGSVVATVTEIRFLAMVEVMLGANSHAVCHSEQEQSFKGIFRCKFDPWSKSP